MTRPRRPILDRAARGAERLDRRPLLVGLVVLAIAGVLTWISIIAINGVPFQGTRTVSAVLPADAPLLKDGDEVRIGGQRVGQVREVDFDPAGTRVRMELNEGEVGAGARATVRLRGLAGLTYVELDPGDAGRPLPDGALIPRSHTASGVELTDVVEVFDAETRVGLRNTLAGYGGGLLGRGDELNALFANLRPALEQGRPLLEAFSPRPGELGDMLAQLRRTTRAAAPPGSRDLEQLVPAGADTFGALANRGGDLAAAFNLLRPFEDEALATLPLAKPLLSDLEVTADVIDPGVRALARTTPDLNRLLATGGKLPEISRLADAARPVLAQAAPALRELRPVAAALKPLGDQGRPFAANLVPYREELIGGPGGFGEWGRFFYPGTGSAADGFAHRAIRFGVVLTCHHGRTEFPAPGTVLSQKRKCGT